MQAGIMLGDEHSLTRNQNLSPVVLNPTEHLVKQWEVTDLKV
jgi:hypothetical protein